MGRRKVVTLRDVLRTAVHPHSGLPEELPALQREGGDSGGILVIVPPRPEASHLPVSLPPSGGIPDVAEPLPVTLLPPRVRPWVPPPRAAPGTRPFIGYVALVVDDNALQAESTASLLKGDSVATTSVEEAMRAFNPQEHKIVVTDLQLTSGGNEGEEIAGRIKASSPSTVVILTTASYSSDNPPKHSVSDFVHSTDDGSVWTGKGELVTKGGDVNPAKTLWELVGRIKAQLPDKDKV